MEHKRLRVSGDPETFRTLRLFADRNDLLVRDVYGYALARLAEQADSGDEELVEAIDDY